MPVARVGARYQVTIPAAVRRQARIRPGQRIEVDFRQGQILIRPVRRRDAADLARMAEPKFAEVWAEEPDGLWESYLETA